MTYILALFLTLYIVKIYPARGVIRNKPVPHKESKNIFANIRIFKAYISDNFHTVQKNHLYRSKQLSPKRYLYYVKKYGIKSIVNLRGAHPHKKWWRKEYAFTKKFKINYYNIPMRASSYSTKENLIFLLSIYQKAPRPILIHCHGGADRTGEAAALWKIEQQKATKQEALAQLKSKFGHIPSRYPAKKNLILLWQGKKWLLRSYNSLLINQQLNDKKQPSLKATRAQISENYLKTIYR